MKEKNAKQRSLETKIQLLGNEVQNLLNINKDLKYDSKNYLK